MTKALKRTGYALLAILALNFLTWAVWGRSTDLILGIHGLNDLAFSAEQDTLVVFTGKMDDLLTWNEVYETSPAFQRRLARAASRHSVFDTTLISEETFDWGENDILRPEARTATRFAFVPIVNAWDRYPFVSIVEVAIVKKGYLETYKCLGVWFFGWWHYACGRNSVQ